MQNGTKQEKGQDDEKICKIFSFFKKMRIQKSF